MGYHEERAYVIVVMVGLEGTIVAVSITVPPVREMIARWILVGLNLERPSFSQEGMARQIFQGGTFIVTRYAPACDRHPRTEWC